MKVFKGLVGWKDSFQELADLWSENKLCEVVQSSDKFSWAKEEGNVLLHEYDRISDLPDYQTGLFANEVKNDDKSGPWIYWPRHPRILNSIKPIPSRDKDIQSVFIGCAENYVQLVNRIHYDWELAVEKFNFSVKLGGNPHTMSNLDFLNMVNRAKFGLSLAGYGSKCQREIEYMALGVIPVFAYDSFNDYHEKLIEGVHFLKAKTPKDAKEKMLCCTDQQIQEMSSNCIEWYNRNSSVSGSFNTTLKIINK